MPTTSTSPTPDVTTEGDEATDDDLLTRWQRTSEIESENPAPGMVSTESLEGRAAEDGAADNGAGADPSRRGLRRLRLSRPALRPTVVAVVIVALVAAVVYGGLRIRHDDQVNAARLAGLRAATVDAPLVATFRYGHVDQDFAAVRAHATAQFAAEYTKARTPLSKLLSQYQASSTGSIRGVGIISATPDKVVVLAVVDQTITNSALKGKTQVVANQEQLTLVHSHGRWLMSAVTATNS